jgi:hypothetical protein
MKNLLIFINQERVLTGENEYMAKIQIDNSLDLGWQREDILFATNFPYEYNGVSALVLSDDTWCDYWPQMSKMNALVALFERKVIGQDLYWFHDLDAFQAYGITEEELGLGDTEMGFTDYGYNAKWNTGSFFFKQSAEDALRLIRDRAYELHTDEERALVDLATGNVAGINERYKRLNHTYNWPGSKNGERYFARMYGNVAKPVKVLHFHPLRRQGRYFSLLGGDNELGIPLIPERLREVFRRHGIC